MPHLCVALAHTRSSTRLMEEEKNNGIVDLKIERKKDTAGCTKDHIKLSIHFQPCHTVHLLIDGKELDGAGAKCKNLFILTATK